MMDEKIKEQWARPINDFKINVKCCYNCQNWEKDFSLMFEYAYNFCKHDNKMHHFDMICQNYNGAAMEENLLAGLTQEERKQLFEELDNLEEKYGRQQIEKLHRFIGFE